MIAWLRRLWQRRWWRKPEPAPAPVEPPANTITAEMITAKALAILHQRRNAIAARRDAEPGAKIGSSLRIRLPVQYTVGDNKPAD